MKAIVFALTVFSLLQFGCVHYAHKHRECCKSNHERSCHCSDKKECCKKECSDSCEVKEDEKEEAKKDSK